MAKILVIDDEPNIRSSLKAAFDRRGHQTVTAADFAEGARLVRGNFDLVFLDIQLPDGNGMDLLESILLSNPQQTVVMISGHADIDTAVKAIQLGAYDFIEKPLSLDRVLITIDNAVAKARLEDERRQLQSRIYGEMIGESPTMVQLKDDIAVSAPLASRFLIRGENGTGKELVAHMIHKLSARSNGPFIAVNCAALPSELIESELFGHVKGSFTGAVRDHKGKFVEADGGTLFLDEISEMPVSLQAKLLRVIETGTVTPVGATDEVKYECNIIAATNRDIENEIKKKNFREDLFYRLNVVHFTVPPLRERGEDITLLAEHFLGQSAGNAGSKPRRIDSAAKGLLLSYPFPGNVRELKNLMERVSIYCPREVVDKNDLARQMPSDTDLTEKTLREAVNEFEFDYIKKIIAQCNGNAAEAARRLGLERSHLYKKLRKHENNSS